MLIYVNGEWVEVEDGEWKEYRIGKATNKGYDD
jgi:hypothetical protein